MSDKTRKVGDLETHQDERGYTYTQVYFINSEDWASVATPYNLIAYGLAGNTAPYDFPSGTYIYDWHRKPAADHYILTVKCHNDGYGAGDGLTIKDPTTQSQRRAFMQDLVLDPKWWNISLTGEKEVGNITPWVPVDDTENPPTKFKKVVLPYLNIHGKRVLKKGEYIYRNASASNVGDPGMGNGEDPEVFTYPDSPFTDASMANFDAKIWAGQTIKTLCFEWFYYTTKDMLLLLNWYGVNGLNDFTPPSSCDDGFSTNNVNTEGKWRSLAFKVVENAKPFGSTSYTSVSRTAQLAPNIGTGGLIWDKNKTFGGLWSW